LPNAGVNTSYTGSVQAAGVGALTFTATGLPDWLQMSASGLFSGTPPSQAVGAYTFTVEVQDEVYDSTLASYRKVSATVALVVSSLEMSIVSGNDQMAFAGEALAPLVVRLSINGVGVPAVPVSFAGGAVVPTDADGRAEWTPGVAPAVMGMFTMVANGGSTGVSFTLASAGARPTAPTGTPISADPVPGTPPTPAVTPLAEVDTEVDVETRWVSSAQGGVYASYSSGMAYGMVGGRFEVHYEDWGPPPYGSSGSKWRSSDAPQEHEGNPPALSGLEWKKGVAAATQITYPDTTDGPVSGVPEGSGGTEWPAWTGQPGVFKFFGGWYGRSSGRSEQTTAEVRLKRKSGTGSVRRTFIAVTEEDGVVKSSELVTLHTGSGDASAPYSLTVMASAPGKSATKRLLPIEVRQPIDSSSPGEPVVTSSLRMSRWFGNVRQSGSDTYDLSQVPNQDHDRIKLRIPIPSKKGQSPVTVRVSTQNCGEGFNTSPTEMDLEETSANSGIFESKYPFILVADAEDDGAQYGSPSVGDGAKNDRTILARPGGKLVVQVSDLNNASIEIPIAPYRHFVEVEAVILNNQNDPWVGAGQTSIVNSQMEAMKSAYASFGIRIVPHIQTVNVSNHPDIVAAYADGKIDVTDPQLGLGYSSSEHPQIISRLDLLGYKTQRNVVLIFTDASLWEFGQGNTLGIAMLRYGYPGWAFVNMGAAAATQRKYLSAHEFGHLLDLLHDGTESGNGPRNSPMTRMMTQGGGNVFTGSPSTSAKRLSRTDNETMKQSEFCQPITP
jgi:hypothetical protein